MLPEPLQIGLELLIQFTGDGGGHRPAIVQYDIAAMAWLGLLLVSRFKYRPHNEFHESLLVWGFAIALGREVLMLAVKVLEAFSIVTLDQLHRVFPPAEHALSDISIVVVIAAFILYLTGQRRFVRFYLWAGCGSVVLIYLATFWWWASYIQANPDSKFGQTWCDWAFRINASVWFAFGATYLWKNAKGWVRNYICFAIGLFFLNDFLKIPDMALDEVYEATIAPVRHALYLFGIPIVGYVYLRVHAMEILDAFGRLELTVQERTRDLAAANAQLVVLSYVDPLTEIANRRAFEDNYTRLYAHMRRSGGTLSVLLIDIDHFKQVNDTYGHLVGDDCLTGVAKLLAATFQRRGDIVARYGGEEFIAVVGNKAPTSVLQLANDLLQRISELSVNAPDGVINITVSIGLAHAGLSPEEDPQALVAKADAMLYEAKRGGRNAVYATDLPNNEC